MVGRRGGGGGGWGVEEQVSQRWECGEGGGPGENFSCLRKTGSESF